MMSPLHVRRACWIFAASLLGASLPRPADAQLQAAFEPAKLVVKAGGAATVELRLRNTGATETAVQVAFPTADKGLKAETEDGKALAAAPAGAPALGLDLPDKLKAGQLASFELDLKARFPDLAKPGRYKVTWNHPSFTPAPALEVLTVESYATIKTNFGEIVIEFHPEAAPKTVENFIKLAKKGFYDGLVFHRIIPGFMMQGGCPKGDGTGGPGYTIPAEFNDRKHVAGTVSMARKQEPDSAGSQFFICFEAKSHLDGQYTAFAEVVRGLEVVKKIEPMGSRSGAPSQKVVMEKVTVSEKLPEARK
jgi:cyclophilin family peptidyl-prolyl cis-trans isomerase